MVVTSASPDYSKTHMALEAYQDMEARNTVSIQLRSSATAAEQLREPSHYDLTHEIWAWVYECIQINESSSNNPVSLQLYIVHDAPKSEWSRVHSFSLSRTGLCRGFLSSKYAKRTLYLGFLRSVRGSEFFELLVALLDWIGDEGGMVGKLNCLSSIPIPKVIRESCMQILRSDFDIRLIPEEM